MSGKDGLVIIKKERPHLILLDLIMPEVDGFDIFRLLKKIPEAKNSKVVILSNSGNEDDIKRGSALGSADYLVKATFGLDRDDGKDWKVFDRKVLEPIY